jgi:LysR family transcriptional regulator, regulator for metE and metH
MTTSILELRHLRTLAALAESGSVSRAAERVHLTQSALSHQLKTLETHYGVPMVKRKGQSVVLTEAGTRLVAAAKEIIEVIRVTERDLARLADAPRGTLRIALECHTCFDWLMPIMDGFRSHWPEIELDLVSGFHPDPLKLLADGQADVVIGSETPRRRGIVYHPLFRFEIVAVLPPHHALSTRKVLNAGDFAEETLITYPVPEDRIDLIRRVLKPARVHPPRRTAELTVAILQLVASQRGIAALPNWGIKNYVDYDYVVARRIGAKGLWSDLYAATTRDAAGLAYVKDFLETARGTCFATLDGLVPIK